MNTNNLDQSEYNEQTEYDSYISSDEEYDEIDAIAETEEDNPITFTNGSYYIGLCYYDKPYNCLLLASAIRPQTIFENQHHSVVSYLTEYSIMYVRKPKIDIMKLYILEDETYSVVLKTYWLRLIQRRWKNIYKKRMDILENQKKISSLRQRELTGKFHHSYRNLPGLEGIL